MNFDKIIKKYREINLFLAVIIALVTLSVLYFVYSRQRGENLMYIRAIVGRDLTVPYWTANSFKKGDVDRSSFGRINARIADLEIYDNFSYNSTVVLLLEARLIKDRSGVFLYKSRPISVGEYIDLRFPEVHQIAVVTYVGKAPPQWETAKLRIRIKKRGDLPESINGIEIGKVIKNKENDELARITDKKITPAEILIDASSGRTISGFDTRRIDAEFELEISARKIGDDYYFQEIQKIKNGDKINFHFKENSLWDYRIISIEKPR